MNRRGFITGLLAAPVVITTPGLLMPVKKLIEPVYAPHEHYMGWDIAHHGIGRALKGEGYHTEADMTDKEEAIFAQWLSGIWTSSNRLS